LRPRPAHDEDAAVIELRDLERSYTVERGGQATTTRAVGPVSLTVPDLQFVAVVGRSGSGKTTLLRLVAGLVRPSRGEVRVDGETVKAPGPDRAVVFQQSALYPWRTVAANVRLGLELSRLAGRREANELVAHYLEVVGLTEFASHYPGQLSGGMQQRVGLARALAVSPRHLLMDEPFGSLDAIRRRELGAELLRIWEHERRTVVFVTHSVDEALVLSDRVVVLRDGLVVQDLGVELERPRHPDSVIDDPAFLTLRHELMEAL
jgi:NitT/TauT family transport system ATP-binding protein